MIAIGQELIIKTRELIMWIITNEVEDKSNVKDEAVQDFDKSDKIRVALTYSNRLGMDWAWFQCWS